MDRHKSFHTSTASDWPLILNGSYKRLCQVGWTWCNVIKKEMCFIRLSLAKPASIIKINQQLYGQSQRWASMVTAWLCHHLPEYLALCALIYLLLPLISQLRITNSIGLWTSICLPDIFRYYRLFSFCLTQMCMWGEESKRVCERE